MVELIISKPMARASIVAGVSLVIGGTIAVLVDGAPPLFWLLVFLGVGLMVGGSVGYTRASAVAVAQHFKERGRT